MFAPRTSGKAHGGSASVVRPHSFSIGSTRSSVPRNTGRREEGAPPGSVMEAAHAPHPSAAIPAEEPANGIIESGENTPSVRSVDPNDVFMSSPIVNSADHAGPSSGRRASGRRGVPPMHLPPASGGSNVNNGPSSGAGTRRMSGNRHAASANQHPLPQAPRSASGRASGPSSSRNTTARPRDPSAGKATARATPLSSSRGSAPRAGGGGKVSSATLGRPLPSSNTASAKRTPPSRSGSGAPKASPNKKLVPPMPHAAEGEQIPDETERPREEIQRDPSVAALLPSSSLLEELQQTEMELLMRRSRTNRFIADLSALMEQLEHETIKTVRQAQGNFNRSTTSEQQMYADI